MRSRILWVAITAVVLAITVLGVPLAFAVSSIVTNDERSELERLALRSAVAVSPGFRTGDPIELPPTETGVEIAVYDEKGLRVSGQGPDRLDTSLERALSGSVVGADLGGRLVETVPVSRGERVIAVVRASSSTSSVRSRTLLWLLVLIGGCIAATMCAVVLAVGQSRRLVVPLKQLARSAGELGAGDFSVRTSPSGVAEIDAAGDSLNQTAERLAELIARERSFSMHASHQLRTPVTQLQLELELGLEKDDEGLREAATSALQSAEQLSRTIDDILRLARPQAEPAGFDVGELLDQSRLQWVGSLASQGRPLRVAVTEPITVAASLPAARQVLHVLLDNALRHGRGTVTMEARRVRGAVAVDVADEGSVSPISLAGDGRLGLSLASSLAVAEGGRLLVDQGGSGTRFTLLLPASGGPSASDA